MSELLTKAKILKQTSYQMSQVTTAQKNEALALIAQALLDNEATILSANAQDVSLGQQNGLSASLIDRLTINSQRLLDISQAVKKLIDLPDPVGQIVKQWTLPNGLKITRQSVPLGVVGMVYEARPNVTVDAATLCLKSSNVVLLRGSTSAKQTNIALVKVMKAALAQSAISPDAIQLLEDTSRQTASEMFKLKTYLDVLIPRGSANLIQTVIEQASVPVIETGAGNCHVYIDKDAQETMVNEIIKNAKVQRPSVCNAIETVLIHQDYPHVESLIKTLQACDVTIHAATALHQQYTETLLATEEDFATEYSDLEIAMTYVPTPEAAIHHINQYGTKHSEAIISHTEENVVKFFRDVDAAVLYHNASTRFTDGEQFGYGAEIGISTQKLHARGPMGLIALTTTKELVEGSGQIRS